MVAAVRLAKVEKRLVDEAVVAKVLVLVALVIVPLPALRVFALTTPPFKTVAARLLTVAFEMVVEARVEEPVVVMVAITALVADKPAEVVVPVTLAVTLLDVVALLVEAFEVMKLELLPKSE